MIAAAQPLNATPAHAIGGRWTATVLLTVCFALAYVDRQVMSLLVTPIKASLGLGGAEIGLLQGVSFSLFYVLASLPLARLADRGDRPRIVAACVAVWSAMSMVCGLAAGFAQLMLARIGLAMAEAGLPPAALTLMADLHDRRGLARATGLFMLAPFVGGGLALIGGGALYAALAARDLPGGLAPWQMLLILAGLPGLLLAPLALLLLREPHGRAGVAPAGGTIADLAALMLGQWRFFILYMLALALLVTALNAHVAWMPTAILRAFPVGERTMGAGFGTAYLVAGSAGTILAGWLLSRAAEGDVLERAIARMRLGAVLLVPFAVVAPFAPTYWAMIALAGIAVFFTSAVVGMGSIPLQLTVPAPLRGQAIALSGLAAALLGTGLGPLLVGIASDTAAAAGAAKPLSAALALVGGIAATGVALALSVALRNRASIQPIPATATADRGQSGRGIS